MYTTCMYMYVRICTYVHLHAHFCGFKPILESFRRQRKERDLLLGFFLIVFKKVPLDCQRLERSLGCRGKYRVPRCWLWVYAQHGKKPEEWRENLFKKKSNARKARDEVKWSFPGIWNRLDWQLTKGRGVVSGHSTDTPTAFESGLIFHYFQTSFWGNCFIIQIRQDRRQQFSMLWQISFQTTVQYCSL